MCPESSSGSPVPAGCGHSPASPQLLARGKLGAAEPSAPSPARDGTGQEPGGRGSPRARRGWKAPGAFGALPRSTRDPRDPPAPPRQRRCPPAPPQHLRAAFPAPRRLLTVLTACEGSAGLLCRGCCLLCPGCCLLCPGCRRSRPLPRTPPFRSARSLSARDRGSLGLSPLLSRPLQLPLVLARPASRTRIRRRLLLLPPPRCPVAPRGRGCTGRVPGASITSPGPFPSPHTPAPRAPLLAGGTGRFKRSEAIYCQD